MTKTSPRKRNPTDITIRNSRAMRKRIDALEAALAQLRKDFTSLAQRGTKR